MCGIVGYVGAGNAQDIILDGLSKLEYRGYDSAGISIIESGKMKTRKLSGRLGVLAGSLEKDPISGTIGMGHTRWATHGAPTDDNAHPHTNGKGTIAVIHNGIIENYRPIKDELLALGYKFKSETDTEVIAHLLDHYYEGDLLQAVFKTEARLRGAYALVVMCESSPDEIIAIRHESPIILGVGEGENFIASDIPAILKYTNKVVYIENKDIVRLTRSGYEIFGEDRKRIDRQVRTIEWDLESATKEGYEHFMLKEIYQQPSVISETINRRLDENGSLFLENIAIDEDTIKLINKIYVVGCGTAYHAGLVGRYLLQEFLKVDAQAEIASEFRYSDHYIDDKTLVVIVSQSGETMDTIGALKAAKAKGARILSITNVVGSSIARESDDIFYTWAGPEIAVASTKAYTTQLTAFYILALYFGKLKGTLEDKCYDEILAELKTLPGKVEASLPAFAEKAKAAAQEIKDSKSIFYLGRGLDYYTALEGALKLKEISYIHTEAFPAGELKHGTIALIEEGTPVIAVATQQSIYEKMVSNIKEVKARGAVVTGITRKRNTDLSEVADTVIYLEESFNIFMPLLSVVYPQLLAYYTSLAKGNDVDKPRNLAKSVTVE
ncbi:glutamine--fructose-6-phosphate transaminase (isomerizing) [Gudongella oleilytica]|uniref:glutamine--fructose-6-phosphate transaminase (isomerizing) n=1 Tax=Gudongella oleilytica TaxID=1582259 RepID=UPI000FF8ABA4|nr:glutamine--fructose-6-phosphate transaminase (isomerizing) [Gudongella oleilytica]